MDLAAKVDFEFIGHRVVHGGELFKDVTEMTEENLSRLSTISGNPIWSLSSPSLVSRLSLNI